MSLSDTRPTYDPSRYYLHEERSALLEGLQARHPQLLRCESIGRTSEGRGLLLATITNSATGPADEKPAIYIDGNTDAGEVVGAAACLHTIHHCVTSYGEDPEITSLLDTRVLYVLPCVDPDNAESLLAGGKPLDIWAKSGPGIIPGDVDGDGRVLTMRVPDPRGVWKVSEKDPRLLIARSPDETRGIYYSLFTEGRLPPGATLADIRRGPAQPYLDFESIPVPNADFIGIWPPTGPGFRKRPMNRPESQALSQFIVEHSNICAVISHHSAGGFILVPTAEPPDDNIFDAIAEIGREATGYSLMKPPLDHPVLINWAWLALGVFSITPEIWNIDAQVGASGEREESEIALLQWIDRELGEDGFVNWHPFDHPDLGPVEIGGVDTYWVSANPPAKFLALECAKLTEFTLRVARLTPLVRIVGVVAEPLGSGLYSVRARIENDGYLPTYLSERARQLNLVEPMTLYVDGAAVRLAHGDQSIEHLGGRAQARSGSMLRTPSRLFLRGFLNDEARLQWIVAGAPGSEVTITCRSQKGGTQRATLTLP